MSQTKEKNLKAAIDALREHQPGEGFGPIGMGHLQTVLDALEEATRADTDMLVAVREGDVRIDGLKGFFVTYREGALLRDIVLSWLAFTQSCVTILDAHGEHAAARTIREAMAALNVAEVVAHTKTGKAVH